MSNELVPRPALGKPTIVAPPPNYSGPGFQTTRLEDVVGLARQNSIWPLPFATSCCGIEFRVVAKPAEDDGDARRVDLDPLVGGVENHA